MRALVLAVAAIAGVLAVLVAGCSPAQVTVNAVANVGGDANVGVITYEVTVSGWKGTATGLRVSVVPAPEIEARLIGSLTVQSDPGPLDISKGNSGFWSGEVHFVASGADKDTISTWDLLVVRVTWADRGIPRAKELTVK
ncbi:MAG: hypothetical protein ACYC6I_08960 [Bacillota bacterium]